jgi:hypothetical protein
MLQLSILGGNHWNEIAHQCFLEKASVKGSPRHASTVTRLDCLQNNRGIISGPEVLNGPRCDRKTRTSEASKTVAAVYDVTLCGQFGHTAAKSRFTGFPFRIHVTLASIDGKVQTNYRS